MLAVDTTLQSVDCMTHLLECAATYIQPQAAVSIEPFLYTVCHPMHTSLGVYLGNSCTSCWPISKLQLEQWAVSSVCVLLTQACSLRMVTSVHNHVPEPCKFGAAGVVVASKAME